MASQAFGRIGTFGLAVAGAAAVVNSALYNGNLYLLISFFKFQLLLLIIRLFNLITDKLIYYIKFPFHLNSFYFFLIKFTDLSFKEIVIVSFDYI